jgi:hypothetical protein
MSTTAAQTERGNVIQALASLPRETLIDETGLAAIFGRHPVSIRRAVRRGELPPGVRVLGRPTWTAKVIVEYLNTRLAEAQRRREKVLQRISKFGA